MTAAVTAIKVNRDGTEMVTSSEDGSVIVWDLLRHVRVNAFFETTKFTSVAYHPDESQLLTCGTDHKLTYWDAADGTAIRVLDGSESALRTLDIDVEGEFFASGGDDMLVRLWNYDDGNCERIGEAHSGPVVKVRLSPDRRRLVSVGVDGTVCIWRL